MDEVVFIVDESGAKGYSDKQEHIPGELGVMAGYLLPANVIDQAIMELDQIYNHCSGNAKKVHITDFTPEQQLQIREYIFDWFIQWSIPWVYEAIYVQGFHESTQERNKLIEGAYKARHSKIKVSHREKRELLHAELFQEVFAKAVEFGINMVGNEFKLNILTDQVDKAIVSEFTQKGDEYLQIGKEKTYIKTGFDTEANKVVQGSITTKITSGAEQLGDLSGVSYCITCDNSSLTLAADVLVNSVHYYLSSLQVKDVGAPLNIEEAISKHPLGSLVCFNTSEANYFSNGMFMYRKTTSEN